MRHWIIENKRLFNIANNAGLRKIIEGLDPRIMVPCGQTFMNNVSKEQRKIQKERFKEVEHLTCGNGDGTSLSTSRNTRCQGLVIVTCNIFIYLFR